jgi:hypothetical protein
MADLQEKERGAARRRQDVLSELVFAIRRGLVRSEPCPRPTQFRGLLLTRRNLAL